MTILSLGAYTRQLEAIKQVASTLDATKPGATWTVPYATNKTAPSKKGVANPVRVVSNSQNPMSTAEILVETMYDTIGGQGYGAVELWSDGKTNHVVTMDVVNLLAVMYQIFDTVQKIRGMAKYSIDDFLLHVNDFNATSPLIRCSRQYTLHFGAQSFLLCPTGQVMAIALDRITLDSQASNKYVWRALSLDADYELAMVTPSATGVDAKPADGYIKTNMLRIPYFMHEFHEVNMTKAESHNYAYKPIVVKQSISSSNPLAKFTIGDTTKA